MRHILFELGPSPSDPELDEAREKADAALARLAAGEPFEELASELSDDDATRDAGGDLGFLDPEEIASELADAAAALEPGGTSGVTRSERGLHLVMLVERVEPGSRPFEQVRSELATEGARRLAARKRADSQSDALVTAIRAGESLEDAARGLEIPIERTSLLRRRPDGFVAGLGSAPELLTTAFALTEENPTSPEIFPVGSKLALIQLLERSDPDEADLEETMQGERERLAAGKRDSFVQNWIDERRTQLINAGELLIDSSIIAGS
jgi:parvulin-like peptidyl-prolyl isomerase